MLSIAVCDDNKLFREKLEEYLAKFALDREIACEIETFSDGQDILRSVSKGALFDIIFLDIEMNHMDGLKAAREIRKFDKVALIIYCSSHSEFAIEAYEVRPFQFLVKPFKPQLLEKYFDDALQEVLADDPYFRYTKDKQSFKIPLKDILYFESNLKKVDIVLSDEARTFREKLNVIEKNLAQSKVEFWRIHQSLLVNRRHICKITFSEVEMSNDAVLPISENRRKYIREKYLDKVANSMVE